MPISWGEQLSSITAFQYNGCIIISMIQIKDDEVIRPNGEWVDEQKHMEDLCVESVFYGEIFTNFVKDSSLQQI